MLLCELPINWPTHKAAPLTILTLASVTAGIAATRFLRATASADVAAKESESEKRKNELFV
jgi:hypothetical protein